MLGGEAMRFKVKYSVTGEIEIQAINMEDALEKFDSGEGYEEGELLDNLDNNFNAFMVSKIPEVEGDDQQ